jgi:hypothetical protein
MDDDFFHRAVLAEAPGIGTGEIPGCSEPESSEGFSMNTNPSSSQNRLESEAMDHETEVSRAIHGGAGPEMTDQADPAKRYHISGSSQPGDMSQHQQAQQ